MLVATAAAIKAFPILAIGYFIYRRMWRATFATLACSGRLAAGGPASVPDARPGRQRSAGLVAGHVFTYNAKGIAQRPFRSFSYKNQSIMAMTHRLLRDVPADGEKVLSEHVAKRARGPAAPGRCSPTARSTWPRCSPRPRKPRMGRRLRAVQTGPPASLAGQRPLARLPRGHRRDPGRHAGLSLFVLAVWPARGRTARTDAIEFAHVTLLIVMFSPLSFNYAFVWLIYPSHRGPLPGPEPPGAGPLAIARAPGSPPSSSSPPWPSSCPSTPRPTATSSSRHSCW